MSGGLANDKLIGGFNDSAGGDIGVFEALEQRFGKFFADDFGVLSDGGEGGTDDFGFGNVVKADNGNIFGDGIACFLKRENNANCGEVVDDHQCGRQFVLFEEGFYGTLPAVDTEIAFDKVSRVEC